MSGAVASNAGAVEKLDPPALPPTVHPRPDGAGWRLLDYSWDAGVARLQYRQIGSGARRTVHQLQPAHEGHAGWCDLHPRTRHAKNEAAAEAARWRPSRRAHRGRA